MKRNIILLAIVIILVAVAIYQNQSAVPQVTKLEEAPRIGFKAPSFALNGLDEKKYTLPLAERKPMVINFWASWCGPCQEETPEFVRLYQKYHGKIEVYGVNGTGSDSIDHVNKFVGDFHVPYPVLLDLDNKVSDRYEVIGFPTTYFVDRNGVIVDKVVGMVDSATLESKIQQLVGR